TRGGGYRNHTHGYPLDFAIYGIRWEKAEAKQKSQRFEVVRASQSGQELTAGRLGQFVALALQDFQVAASRWLRLVRDRLLQNRRFCPPRLHTNSCGDFTLLQRAHWFDLRGYAELDVFSMHLDSLFCYAAHYCGIKEVVLPEPMNLYHIEHNAGWTPEAHNLLFDRLAKLGIPCMDSGAIIDWVEKMHHAGRGRLFNDDNWGLADMMLPETRLSTPISKPVAA